MRLDRKRLCEVLNYKRCMIESGCSEKWQRKYDFDIDEAAACVAGMGCGDFLLDFLDKWSYTSLDVYHLGKMKPTKVLHLIKRYPLIMEVWQDVCVTKEHLYFSDAYRLYHFLLLRALMHSEFYLNPDCRKLEHLFFSETKRLFDTGSISIEDLRRNDDRWLDAIVRAGKDAAWCTHPRDVSWQRFDIEKDADAFYEGNNSVFHKEYIKPFETGMHWLVMHKGKVMPLCEALPKNFINEMKSLSWAREGWYVYYSLAE